LQVACVLLGTVGFDGALIAGKIINSGFMYMGVVVSGCETNHAIQVLLLIVTLKLDNFAYFSPTIIRSLGHSPVKTQLYSVAPYACGFFFAMLVAWSSDRLKHRYAFVMSAIFLALAGYITLLILHDKPNAQYAALFVAAAGNFSVMPVILCWSNTNRG
jgi:MFS family permease